MGARPRNSPARWPRFQLECIRAPASYRGTLSFDSSLPRRPLIFLARAVDGYFHLIVQPTGGVSLMDGS